jgi:hypothetical protein
VNRVLDLIVSSGSVFSEAFGSYCSLFHCLLRGRACEPEAANIQFWR